MPEKDPTTYSLITYAWVFILSAWGGAVNFMELIGELMTSAFAGVLTFWLCQAAEINNLITAALVGISGHMGSRAIFHFEKWAESRFPSSGGK
jgi:hypothetical protein